MRLLRSPIVLALLGGALFLGTTAGVLLSVRDDLKSAAGEQKPEAPDKTAVPRVLWTFKADDVDAMVREVAAERRKLDARAANLDKQQAQLEAEKAEIEKRRDEVKTLRDQIAKALPEVQEIEAKNLKTLAQTYSTMTPQAVVAILRESDETTAVKILSFMKTDKVGAILQEMTRAQAASNDATGDTMPKRAARISDKLRLLKTLPKKDTTL